MTIGSLGLRSSGSYGSLQQQQFQFQNGSLPNQTTPPVNSRKPAKMVKEKERLFPWIVKFAPRKKVGMLLLCAVSAAVFLWVLYVGKGEDAPESSMKNIRFNSTLDYNGFPPVPVQNETFKVGMIPGEDAPESSMKNIRFNSTLDYNGFPPVPVQNETFKVGTSSEENIVEGNATLGWLLSPPPPPPPPPLPPLVYFTGYTLPPGNPCEGFTLPPPPADPKRTGPRPCPVCYLPMEQVLGLIPDAPSFSPVLKSLTYIHEENLTKTEFGGSEFGGYPSLAQRNDSYDIRESMSVHCGFVRGVKPGQGTGFDIDDSDLLEMETCQGVVVASAIFGAFDLIRQPKNISDYAKKNACFYMFVDEETEAFLRNSSAVDSNKKSGLWQIVVVRNLPYTDARRNGKVPKLLIHRLFPNARYSLWIDGKLQLVVDPYQVLERFLWRKNATFAISRHYRRFDVFVEAEANKVAGKYENASIDFQIEFYKKEGLTPYSLAKLPITSDVPEGCVIIREHVPISNLFTCLWFNEVDRFTSRDQISFSTVRDKINSKTNWTINMFLDCERRNFVVQGYHRDVLESRGIHPPIAIVHPPPPIMEEQPKKTVPEVLAESIGTPSKKIPTKRARDRKSKRHRKVAAGSKEITSS